MVGCPRVRDNPVDVNTASRLQAWPALTGRSRAFSLRSWHFRRDQWRRGCWRVPPHRDTPRFGV